MLSEVNSTAKRPRRRVKPVAKEFTMEDLEHRFDAHDAAIRAIRGDMTIQATAAQGMQKDLVQISADIKALVIAMGEEKEDGQGNYLGTGLLGRVRRVERGQRSLRELYHRWIAFGAGFSACVAIVVVLVGWLLSGGLVPMLKGIGALH